MRSWLFYQRSGFVIAPVRKRVLFYASRITHCGLFLALLLAACAPLQPAAPPDPPPTTRPPAFTLIPSAPNPADTPTSAPTPTVPPTPAPTPTPALVRLTEPGCCVQPFWSRDGSLIFFLDKPSAEAPSGLYSVTPDRPGEPPQFFSERPGYYSTDMTLLVYPERGLAVVENLPTGERWEVNTNGRPPAFSPDGRRMVWQVGGGSGPNNNRRSDLYVANVDGSEARFVATFIGGGAQAWFPDSARLLVVARPAPEVQDRALMVLALADGSTRQLAQAERIGSVRLSPGGTWVAYLITFAPNPADNGIWLARTDGGGMKRLEQYGAYQWRDDDRLLLVPAEMGQGSHRLLEVEAATGQARPITDPAETPFTIANGDWSVGPQGDRIVFVNAADRALWLLQFP